MKSVLKLVLKVIMITVQLKNGDKKKTRCSPDLGQVNTPVNSLVNNPSKTMVHNKLPE